MSLLSLSTSLLWMAAAGLSAAPQNIVDSALADAEPPPALRAAFRATLASRSGQRRIEYDPMKPSGNRFRVLESFGDDAELDQIVTDWAQEQQPDVRLFADDLRESLGMGRIVRDGGNWRISFAHRLSGNDGPLDALVSQQMVGALTLDPENGRLSSLTYRNKQPFKTPDGSVVSAYSQTYSFGRSERWGVTFVTGYRLEATGGRFGVRDSRTFDVEITDVAFTLANDVDCVLDSKPYRKK